MVTSPIPDPSHVRPCFISAGQQAEFETLVRVTLRSLWSSGLEQAWGVARALCGLSHDASAVMRCARAEHLSVAGSRIGTFP